MGVKFQEKELEMVLQSAPSYPSVLSIVESCNYFGLKTAAYRADFTKLKAEIPAIVHFKAEMDKFVLLNKMSDDKVNYYDATIYRNIECSLNEFCNKWTGIIIISINNKKSIHNKKKFTTNISPVWLFIAFSICCTLFYGFENAQSLTLLFYAIGLLILKFIGLWLSIVLVRHEIGSTHSVFDAFCHKRDSFDCDKVINSNVSQLFNLVTLADLGCVYFVMGIISLILGVFSGLLYHIVTIIFYISACCIPFILFSVFYQRFVVKKWCPLCLSVMGIILLENILFLFYGQTKLNFTALHSSIILMLFSFISSLIALQWIKQSSKNSYKLFNTIKSQLKLKRNPIIFASLFGHEAFSSLPKDDSFIIGEKESAITITTLLSPFCIPCKKTANEIIELIERYPQLIQWHIRLDGVTSSEYAEINKIQLSLAELYFKGDSSKVKLSIIKDWFKEQNFESFSKEHAIKSISKESIRFFAQHVKNNGMLKTNKVPTVWINNRTLPQEYSIKDIPFLLTNVNVLLKVTM
jgi:uncharacterized membrane protein/thiol-disulfide isomerase/thioredoxin